MPLEIDIAAAYSGWEKSGFSLDDSIKAAVEASIAATPFAAALRDRDTEISLVLCDDAFIRKLNGDYREKDKATNVLSFPQTDFDDPEKLPGFVSLGDVILAFETIRREADEQGKSLQTHFTHLVVHGTLHLMGYDHETADEAREMETLEIKILGGLGIENPYADSRFVA